MTKPVTHPVANPSANSAAKPHLIYLVTEDHYFYSHRLPTARAALRAGYDVTVITNVKAHGDRIAAEGFRVLPLSLDRRSLNPFKGLWHVMKIAALYRREKPDVVHHIAMKPVLYGALAAWWTGVPVVINAFAGLGYLFTARSVLARVLRGPLFALFRFVLRQPSSFLLLQNRDDLATLKSLGMTPADEEHIVVIPGSGVDTDHYQASVPPAVQPDVICVFAGRLIGIKGLATLQAAFNLLADRAAHIKLWLCGTPDPANPGSWTAEQVESWTWQTPTVVYKGYQDMATVWPQAHIALQPSYGGEGVPKSLLEAAACGRAIIATDVPGCRDVVQDGRNGYLVPPHDHEALAAAIIKLTTDEARLHAMGAASRALVMEKGFSATAVSAQAEALYRRFVHV